MNKNEAAQRLIGEAKALESQVGFLNSLPNLKGQIPSPPPPSPLTTLTSTSTSPVAQTASNSPPITTPTSNHNDVIQAQLGRKIFFTGRLCSGKDFVASKLGANVFGFADPIYTLAEYLFNIKVTSTEGKDKPGVRKVLQTIGQWGRNEISVQYPLTVERAMFCLMIRSLASNNAFHIPGVDWKSFGLSPDLWIDGLLNRVRAFSADVDVDLGRVVVTNCRFPNEYNKLIEDGWQHWHIVCSPQTLVGRLRQRALTPNSPEVTDFSEQMAFGLDKNLAAKLLGPDTGRKLQVVWSDESVPPPSKRMYSLEQFTQLVYEKNEKNVSE